jgi:CO/xanthine dehydrogenase FAD-binding subunit
MTLRVVYRPDEFVVPGSLEEVLSVISQNPEASRVIAGNTTMFEFASRGLAPDVKVVVDITKAGLNWLEERDDGLHIGATVTLTELAKTTRLGSPYYGAVSETAKEITPTQVRNVATVGGEVCSGIPFFDLPPVLLALGSRVTIVRKGASRSLPLKEFSPEYLMVALEPGEIVSEVVVPKPVGPAAASFKKLGRTASDFAVVNAAVSVSLDERSHVCTKASVWLGGVGSAYHECSATESLLAGSRLDKSAIDAAARVAADFEPSPSLQASPEYKKMVIPVLVRDCIQNAAGKLAQR